MQLFSLRNRTHDIGRLMETERQQLVHYACCRLGNSDDAEDAVQDLFVKLHQRMDGNVKNPMAYVYRSLANLCVSRLRAASHLRIVSLDGQPEPVETVFDEEKESQYRRIQELLTQIPDEQAEVIRLRYYGNKSFREIAEMLDVSVSTVKSRFVYGLGKIGRGMRASSLSNNKR